MEEMLVRSVADILFHPLHHFPGFRLQGFWSQSFGFSARFCGVNHIMESIPTTPKGISPRVSGALDQPVRTVAQPLVLGPGPWKENSSNNTQSYETAANRERILCRNVSNGVSPPGEFILRIVESILTSFARALIVARQRPPHFAGLGHHCVPRFAYGASGRFARTVQRIHSRFFGALGLFLPGRRGLVVSVSVLADQFHGEPGQSRAR